MILETTAVRQIVPEANDLMPVLMGVQRLAAAASEDACELLDIDMQFHRCVIETSRNRALLQAWDAIAGVIHAVCRFNLTESQAYNTWYVQTFRERHMGLFIALMNGTDAAVPLFSEHISDAQAISHRAFEKTRPRKESSHDSCPD